MSAEKLPETLTLVKCPCRHLGCDSYDIRELSHMDGAGYPQEIAAALALRWNVHDALLEAANGVLTEFANNMGADWRTLDLGGPISYLAAAVKQAEGIPE